MRNEISIVALALAVAGGLLAAGGGSTLLAGKIKWPEVTTAVAAIVDPLIHVQKEI